MVPLVVLVNRRARSRVRQRYRLCRSYNFPVPGLKVGVAAVGVPEDPKKYVPAAMALLL